MNFQDFFGGGFGGGFHGHGGGRSDEPIDNESYYKELGVSKSASAGEIKKAYHKLSRIHHPDKGGDEEKFKLIQEAFDCLSNSEKRELYDQGGKDAVEKGGAPSSDPFGMFGTRRQPKPGERKGKSVKHNLKVTLEECYNGSVRKLRLGRVVIDKSTPVRKCSQCTGGTVMKTIRRGNMIQQFQQVLSLPFFLSPPAVAVAAEKQPDTPRPPLLLLLFPLGPSLTRADAGVRRGRLRQRLHLQTAANEGDS